jgi:uncharacterized protein
MTTFFETQEKCPICANDVTISHLTSTNYFGQHSDFHRMTMGFSPLPLLMNTCPQCGYSGNAQAFTASEAMSSAFKQQIIESLQSIVKSQPLTAGRRYELFALQEELRGASAHEMADYYLRASWAARDEGDLHEADYQRYAVTFFQKALDTDELNEADEGIVTYMIGELHRRLGDAETATQWFTRVIDRARHDPSWQHVAELAQRQHETPRNTM